ncbi:MAG TPA: AraC family transcriptional regulator ligand-binding domain-containing protein [Cyclobacteriaceae bacterium]
MNERHYGLYLLFCDKNPINYDMHAQMSILRDIIYGATARGADFKSVCEQLQLDPQHLNDSERLVPFEPAAKIWDVVLEQTKDPLLGLHLGEEISPAILGMIGYLMQSSSTLREAVITFAKFNALHSTMLKYVIEESDEKACIQFEAAPVWQHQYPESVRQSIELAMSGLLKIFSILSGRKIFPAKVELSYPGRALKEYERIFQSAIEFNSNKSALIFRKRDLFTNVISHDRSLFVCFNELLDQKLKSLKGDEKFSDHIRQLIITDFKGAIPSIENIATHLNLTSRSFQRKLKEEGTSYRELVSLFKKELAQAIMSKEKFRISEVADLLGYSDSSAFRKAFNKWNIHLKN